MARLPGISKNLNAFLDMLAYSEGTAGRGDDGYNVLFGGKLFESYADHPRIKFYEKKDEFIKNGRVDYTTAAGRYQLLSRYFDVYSRNLELFDFSPESQDAIAIQQIKERKALNDIEAGRFTVAVSKVRNIWASLPGAGYQQPERSIEKLKEAYLKAGGVVA